MFPASLTWTCGVLWALVGIAWLVFDNARAWARHRASLLPGRAHRLALSAWLLSLLSTWMGPAMPLGAALAFALGALMRRRVLRGEARPRSELPAEMAMRNALVVMTIFVGVGLAIWSGWQTLEPDGTSSSAPRGEGADARGHALSTTRLALARDVGHGVPLALRRNS